MSETTDSDEYPDSIELYDIEDLGVAKGEGESWAEVVERLRGRDDDRWHYCICGARYRSRGPALLCCSERFIDEEIATDGGTPTATETEHYADGSFVTCPDCGGDLEYQNRELALCPDCDAEFSHYYADDGTNQLFRAPNMDRVVTVYDPADDQRNDSEELVTDGGSTVDWPPSFERSNPDRRSPNRNYGVSLHDAIEELDAEMDRLGVDDWRLDTAMRHQSRNPNYPYANQSEPNDPSVVLRWSMDGDQFAVACDAYSRVRDNLRTIGLYVREKRKMEQRPVTTGESEFANARLPSGEEDAIAVSSPAHVVLGVDENASADEIEAAYRERVKEAHPDNGGSSEELREVREAKEVLLDGA